MIVDKAPGVSFHGTDGLVQAVRRRLNMDGLCTVHRLDRVTSGLVLFARGKGAARAFSEMFRDRWIEKYYIALSDKRPDRKRGIVTGDILKSRRGTYRLARSRRSPSETRFMYAGRAEGMSIIFLRPLTGKTHQVRVVLKSLGAPVFGDPLYNRRSLGDVRADRAYLHAAALRFSFGGRGYEFMSLPGIGGLFKNEEIEKKLKEGISKMLHLQS